MIEPHDATASPEQTLYKLTTSDGWTRKGRYNACLWGEGVTHSGTGEGDLCGPGYIHAYTSPLLAVVLNPGHANLYDPWLWEAQGLVAKTDFGLKVGCVSLTTIRRLDLPVATTQQRVRFAILCAMEVCEDPAWRSWASAWLDGTDRSAVAATRATAASTAASWAAEAVRRAAAASWAAAAAVEAAEAAAMMAARPLDLVALAERAVREELAL